MTELELAKRDSDERISHLRNSLNAEAGYCLRVGKEGSDEDITIKSWQLHTIGTYLYRAQNLITYYDSEIARLNSNNVASRFDDYDKPLWPNWDD